MRQKSDVIGDQRPLFHNWKGDFRGISLVEVMVVVGILAVLALFAAPNMEHFSQDRKVAAVFRDINSLLVDARLQAYKTNANVVVQFSSENSDGTLDEIFSFRDNGEGGGTAKDGIHQEGEPILETLSASRWGGGGTADSLRRWPISFSTNLGGTLNRLTLRGRPGIFGGTIHVLWGGQDKGRLIINSMGRVRTER